jgi:hypothetical protein
MFTHSLLISALLLGSLPALAQAQSQPGILPAAAKPAAPPPNFSAPANVRPGSQKPTVSTVAYSPISPGSSFETQVNDDTEIDHEALERVNAGLADRGYRVVETAPYVMVIEADLVRSERQDSPLAYGIVRDDESRFEGRLYSTSQTSLLNPLPPVDTSSRTYRISLSVYDRASGLYLWRGSANRNDPNIDVNQASAEMVAALLTHLGQTVK